MSIRTFHAGDDQNQMEIYNAAAGDFPKFKPATVVEIRRRTQAADFDPGMRFFAEHDGKTVGYCLFNPNGRVSFPWCLPGYEQNADELFQRVLDAAKARGLRTVFAAYRADWPEVHAFFLEHEFRRARDMVNFVIDLVDMPTPIARPTSSMSALEPNDMSALLQMMPEALRVESVEELEKHLLHNTYFPSDAAYAVRDPNDGKPVAVGVLVLNEEYANPRAVDAMMPCFRLGAFGTEGRNTKRINGLFSFLARRDVNVNAIGLDLIGQAAYRLRRHDEIESLAAQVPSDAQALLGFYERFFERQGSFPVFERAL